MTTLRWLAYLCLAAMFVTDYGLGLWVRPPPHAAYVGVIAVALGVEARHFRSIILKMMRAFAGGDDI